MSWTTQKIRKEPHLSQKEIMVEKATSSDNGLTTSSAILVERASKKKRAK
jgi:hypothetical protein